MEFNIWRKGEGVLHPQSLYRIMKDTMTGKDLKYKSDEEVLILSARNPTSFSILVDRYQEKFLRKAKYILGARGLEDAEEIVQETFTKIYLNAQKFKTIHGASFKSWGYKILLNTVFTHCKKLRKKGVVLSFENEIDIERIDTALKEDEIGKLELYDHILSILSRMPNILANVLTLHFLEDKPYKEIAKMENVSVSAIKARISRAKKEFKKIEKTMPIYL